MRQERNGEYVITREGSRRRTCDNVLRKEMQTSSQIRENELNRNDRRNVNS